MPDGIIAELLAITQGDRGSGLLIRLILYTGTLLVIVSSVLALFRHTTWDDWRVFFGGHETPPEPPVRPNHPPTVNFSQPAAKGGDWREAHKGSVVDLRTRGRIQ